MTAWRLILDGPGAGAWNMAVDSVMLAAHEDGSAPPTLRLYRWAVPTASIGRFQSADDVDFLACAELGIDACRRPTGGRGVLHDDELTYSIIAGVADGLPRGVASSYRVLCGALVAAYRRLGVDASLTSRAHARPSSAACYLQATAADLSLGAAKLSGSAQVWHRESVLQHGSFVVSRDVSREARVFGLSASAAVELAGRTATIEDALGRRPTFEEIASAVAKAISEHLGVRLDEGPLSEGERDAATALESRFRVEGASSGPRPGGLRPEVKP